MRLLQNSCKTTLIHFAIVLYLLGALGCSKTSTHDILLEKDKRSSDKIPLVIDPVVTARDNERTPERHEGSVDVTPKQKEVANIAAKNSKKGRKSKSLSLPDCSPSTLLDSSSDIKPDSACVGVGPVVSPKINPGLIGVDTLDVGRYLTILSSTNKDECLPLPNEMYVSEFPGIKFAKPTGNAFAKGSKTELFIYNGGSVDLIVKGMSKDATSWTRASFDRERAFLLTFSGLDRFPTLYTPIVTNRCVLVMSKEGSFDLKAFSSKSMPELISILIASIGLVKNLHERGFVHGDIHLRQFVYDLLPSKAESLRLIDYGRAAPFITKEGAHIPNIRTESSDHWNAKILSVFELDNLPKTRRDDFNRLAAMFLRLLPPKYTTEYTNAVKKISKNSHTYRKDLSSLKKNRPFGKQTPKIFKDFYTYTLNLAHDERPDYDGWIDKWTEHANTYTP